ncbi:MAG: GNAT family N-acetyltransferase [Oscillospiraceae bacterium]|jgi:GNAT superfamily N-acetyltransferase|nr:GNAT family N-acetyltransferase [Oscillospiraceae bacterium]
METITPLTFEPLKTEEFRAFWAAAHRETFRLTFGSEIADSDLAKELDRTRGYSEKSPDSSVIGTVGGTPAAIAQLEKRAGGGGSFGWVHFYYVSPQFRGNGYGRKLVDYSVEYFRNFELTRFYLRVAEINAGAIQFYLKCGFTRSPNGDKSGRAGRELMMAYDCCGSDSAATP